MNQVRRHIHSCIYLNRNNKTQGLLYPIENSWARILPYRFYLYIEFSSLM